MIASRPWSLLRDALVPVAVFAIGCSASQDLGRDQPRPEDPNAARDPLDQHEGFGHDWACPDSPLARDLACPLTQPNEGDHCSPRASAPCSYGTADGEGQTFQSLCICTRYQQWSCLASATFRTLLSPPKDRDPCTSAVEVTRPCKGSECEACRGVPVCEITCRCVGGAFRCGV